MEKTNQTKGTIFIVSTPIGNKKDITIRATEVLQNCDIVVGEEMKEASRVLINLNLNKPIELLNEHNEKEKVQQLIDIVLLGKSIALISDCGTPVFADPGIELIRAALANNITITVVPGASSIMAAIVRSGFDLKRFLYAGFLSRNTQDRLKEIQDLSNFPYTFVVMDTPYRLKVLLQDFAQVMPQRRAYIGMNLTMPSETHHYGTISELYEKFKSIRIRNEYVIVIEGYALGKLFAVQDSTNIETDKSYKNDGINPKIIKRKKKIEIRLTKGKKSSNYIDDKKNDKELAQKNKNSDFNFRISPNNKHRKTNRLNLKKRSSKSTNPNKKGKKD